MIKRTSNGVYYRIFSKIYEQNAKKMCLDCQDFIKKGSKILDLGCGSGIVAKNFQNFFQAEIIGVDIKDNRIFKIPFQIIDGKNLPFSENSFDVVLISYVLHHSRDPISLIKEAKRISRDKIIIYEDLPKGFMSKLICKIHGFAFDKFFQNPTSTSFKLEEEWERIFNNTGLNVILKERVKSFPVNKELFILGM